MEADVGFLEDNPHLFYRNCESCEGRGYISEENQDKCEYCYGEGRLDLEPYQYFLCDIPEWQKDRLMSYGVEVGYSDLLDLHVLPIYDFGTSWSAFSYSKEVEDDYVLAHDETLTRSTVY